MSKKSDLVVVVQQLALKTPACQFQKIPFVETWLLLVVLRKDDDDAIFVRKRRARARCIRIGRNGIA